MVRIAPGLFFTGILLGFVCMFRINVRIFKIVEAWRPQKDRPWWDPMSFFLGIQLRDSVGLEIAGLAVALAITALAIQLLQPA